jgi:hypothetical protein
MAKKRNEGGSIMRTRKVQTKVVPFTSFTDIKAVRKLKKKGYVVSSIDWDTATLTKGGK